MFAADCCMLHIHWWMRSQKNHASLNFKKTELVRASYVPSFPLFALLTTTFRSCGHLQTPGGKAITPEPGGLLSKTLACQTISDCPATPPITPSDIVCKIPTSAPLHLQWNLGTKFSYNNSFFFLRAKIWEQPRSNKILWITMKIFKVMLQKYFTFIKHVYNTLFYENRKF